MDKSLILRKVQEYYEFTKDKDFAVFLGIKHNTLSNWYSRGTMDYDLIVTKCDEINANWLLTGKGEMLKEKTISERLEQFKFENGLAYYDLGKIVGFEPGEIHLAIKRNEVTEAQIILISEKFDIPKEWLLTGKGEMPKVNKEVINRVSESQSAYAKEGNKLGILEKEIEFLKEANIFLKDANTSLKETNELLKYKIKSLETENEILKTKSE